MEPMYKHDCDNCVFHGTISDKDVYTCGNDGDKTIVVRYSDEGSDYSSSSIYSDELVDLFQGIRLELVKGIHGKDAIYLTVGLRREKYENRY